ncbi:hypothetical protein SPWS13_3143 [Shewanella putrefaciens]|nr:hypothetical protein SPWS13_3143 [Shewanella putrefaciens]
MSAKHGREKRHYPASTPQGESCIRALKIKTNAMDKIGTADHIAQRGSLSGSYRWSRQESLTDSHAEHCTKVQFKQQHTGIHNPSRT